MFSITVALLMAGPVAATLPNWTPEWSMPLSTVFMPCNETGFTDPAIAAKFGLADFDWSNAKVAWSNAKPMDCEERLVSQAKMVKDINPKTHVMVYRNLVKALPWYTSVREKITDPAYAGWFLHFKKGGATANGTWHVPQCTTGTNPAAVEKCSDLYHDQEQTPRASAGNGASRVQHGDWWIYNVTNDVSGMHPGWKTIISGGPQTGWEGCRESADTHRMKGFTFWKYNESLQQGTCWLTNDWNTPCAQQGCSSKAPSEQLGHVSGWKPAAGEAPPPIPGNGAGRLCADGDCDCGKGLPCGEYLWDHRNQSLRSWLVDEFVGGTNGLGNPSVDGFFFDDGWSTKANPIPPWAKNTYRQCDMAVGGGATEEDFYCTADTGLTPADVAEIHGNWTSTMAAVNAKVNQDKGFVFQELLSRAASLDLADPRPKCAQYLRKQCVANSTVSRGPLSFEFTRKAFHDPFPLPFPVQDVAMFLLVRGPFAWLGYSWMGCNTGKVAGSLRPKEVEVDYGVPVDDHCIETAAGSGVFKRAWSKASVTMDCNTWTGSLTMH